MKIFEILNEDSSTVTGTNCGNCKFTKGTEKVSVDKDELNAQGGLIISDKKELSDAKNGDLITLPGKGTKPKKKIWCKNKGINQFVTDRMCCAYWDAPGVVRDFKKK